MRDQKIILVTGGRAGVGLAIATACQRRGGIVFVTSRKQSSFPKQVLTDRINVLPLDVCEEESVHQTFAFIADRVGPLDSLVNNAGIGIFKPILDISADEFRQTMEINLLGSFLCSQAAIKQMRGKGGRIVNVGSIVDRMPADGNAAYGVSKWGLRGLSASITQEGAAENIFATHVSLGAVYTEIWQSRDGFLADDMLPLDVVGDQIANVVFTPISARIDNLELFPKKGLL